MKRSYVLLSLLAFVNCIWSQVTFNIPIDFDLNIERGTSVITEVDGYLVCGFGTAQEFGGFTAIKLIKTDPDGNIEWYKLIGKNLFNFFPYDGSLIKITNNHYIIAGTAENINNGERDALLIKLNVFGDTIFVKTFGGALEDNFYSCVEDSSGNIYAIGDTKSFGNVDGDLYIVKTDSNGNLLLQKKMGGNRQDRGVDLLLTKNDEILAGGWSYTSLNVAKSYFLRLDDSLNVLTQKYYGTNGLNCGVYFLTEDQERFFMFSCIDSFISATNFNRPSYIAEIDTSGAILWRTVFSDYEEHYLVAKENSIRDNSILIGGWIYDSHFIGHQVGWLLKLTTNGNITWEKRYSLPNEFFASRFCISDVRDIKSTDDGGVIATGLIATSSSDIWLLKLDSVGCLNNYCGLADTNCYYQPSCITDTIDSCLTPPCDTVGINIGESTQLQLVEVYPNPAKDELIAEYSLGETVARFEIIDMMGRKQMHLVLNEKTGKKIIKISQLPEGIHLYKVSANSTFIQKGKFIIMR